MELSNTHLPTNDCSRGVNGVGVGVACVTGAGAGWLFCLLHPTMRMIDNSARIVFFMILAE